MKVTVLIDNHADADLAQEWGLSFHIEYEGKQILLDMGSSDNFAKNADLLGIDLSRVDYAVLSHAHYDHADGMEAFFAGNEKAKLYLQEAAEENCYGLNQEGELHYIGIREGFLAKYANRLIRVHGCHRIAEGIFLLGHTTPGLEKIGRRVGMKVFVKGEWQPDCFAHEQTLIFRTGKGLVLFNSCSHVGPKVILSEVKEAFPGEEVRAYFGGLHQFRSTPEETLEVGRALQQAGTKKVYTGHCTGDEACQLLREQLGDAVEVFCSGYTVTLE